MTTEFSGIVEFEIGSPTFVLGGKRFVYSCAEPTIIALNSKQITLRHTTSGTDIADALDMAALQNNDDHCYIESMTEVALNVFEIGLGS